MNSCIQIQIDSNINNLESECLRSPVFAWSQGLTKIDYFPPVLYISPTNTCSHRCAVCAHPQWTRKGRDNDGNKQRGYMEWERFKYIADNIPKDVARIYFYKHGEPLLHPRYIEMSRYLRNSVGDEIDIALSTNGTNLNPEHDTPLLETFNVILFSIYGLDSQTFSRLHGRDNFEKVLSNIKRFHSVYVKKKQPRARVYFNFVRQKGNAHQSDKEVREFFAIHFPAFHCGIHGIYNFAGRINEGNYRIFENGNPALFPVCSFPYSVFTLLWDGNVGHCMVDIEELVHNGRVPNTSIQSLPNHFGLQEYRQASQLRDYDKLSARKMECGKCNWLFHLRAQSLNYLTLHTEKLAKQYALQDSHGLVLSGQESLYNGLIHFLKGDMNASLGSFALAQTISADETIRKKSIQWENNVRSVFKMRSNLEHWESCFRDEGTSIRDLFKTTYFEHSDTGVIERLDPDKF